MNKKVPIEMVIRPILMLAIMIDKRGNQLLLSNLGLTLSQFKVLVALSVLEGASQKAVADMWNVTEASVSRQVGILVKKGMISRKQQLHNAKNQYELALTKKGAGCVASAKKIFDEAFEAVFVDIGHDDRRAMVTTSHKLLSAIAENLGDAALPIDRAKEYE